MAVKWTADQQKVIDARNVSLLVSAAAGSGKTAVLVERILSLVTQEKDPADIDRLLVVTFTNAAASEMRERLRDALEQRAAAEPENVHLQRQLVLVHNARIMTIHSFCLEVLRNHFQEAGVDPAFRIADEGEIRLLEQDTARETVDAAYEKRDPAFSEFLERFTPGKNDKILEETLIRIYHFSQGQPWPEEWLKKCCQTYSPKAEDSWLGEIGCRLEKILEDCKRQLMYAVALSEEPDGPAPYLKTLEEDLDRLEKLSGGTEEWEDRSPRQVYEAAAERFAGFGAFSRLAPVRGKNVSPQKKQQVQEIRRQVKDAVEELQEQYFFEDCETVFRELYESGSTVRMLADLTLDFMERLGQAKEEKNILDFSDLEHEALKVLTRRDEDGAVQPSKAALEYAELFREVMIDEYQDSNLVQELLLSSVSGGPGHPHNRFMVGDIKQSIYRFRLASPELFTEKYQAYKADGRNALKIDLHQNFRSREQVLGSVNYVFEKIMNRDLGGIDYDEKAALHPGAVFASREDGVDPSVYDTELLLLRLEEGERMEQEARLAGRRILELAGNELVWDKETGEYRPARYRDMVILLRTVTGWAETFSKVLMEMGIPCHTASQKGYFDTVEVQNVLSYLQILDNPIQDLPLAGVMRSAIGGFTDEELAVIRSETAAPHFYGCCREYMEQGSQRALKEKLEGFFETWQRIRRKTQYTPVHEILWEILDTTGYGEYAAALPGGAQRKANLDMLVEKAVSYEATSYRGLYHFVRYIESLKKYEVDYGEANLEGEGEDSLRILSIHKSKGLEFPIVFVCGLSKSFNQTDRRSRLVMHQELGMGCDCVDPARRLKSPTLLKKVIQGKMDEENLGEELRILYVAMTRAKEKLILTGTVAKLEDRIAKWYLAGEKRGGKISCGALLKASSYLDFLMPALLRHPAAAGLLAIAGLEEEKREDTEAGFRIRLIEEAELALAVEDRKEADTLGLQRLLELSGEECQDEEARQYLEQVFAARYPWEKDRDIIGKLTVSELKKLSHIPEEEEEVRLYQEETVIPLIPRFREEKTEIAGAARGTLYHRFMENLDFSKKDQLELQLEELVTCGKMSREESQAVRLEEIRRFLECGTGRRMARAAARGELFREQPFVLGVPADTIRSGWNPQETVLVQGIIDAFFYLEDGSIAVADYKTDRVSREEELVRKYKVQLDYYGTALARLTGRRVEEKVIYSFCLGKEIIL